MATGPQRTLTLTICADSTGGPPGMDGLVWICGREPGHAGPHKDICYPVTWRHPAPAQAGA